RQWGGSISAAGKSGPAELLALGLIMGLAFYIGMIPRLDYGYPLHSDEWTHFDEARAIVTTGTIPSYDPVTGEARADPITGEVRGSTHEEVGYHLFLAEFQLLTGLPWLTIFRFLPSSVFALTALCAYIFGKRGGFGLEAALLVCLVPTTVRFLGPAFAVPVALGLLFVPLVLFLVSYLWASRGLPLLLLPLLSFLFITHAPTALFVSLLIVVHGLFQTVRSPSTERSVRQRPLAQMAAVLGAIALASLLFLVHNPWIVDTAATETSVPDSLLTIPGGIISRLGYIPYGLFVLGLGALAISRRRTDRALLVATLLAALFVFLYYCFGVGNWVLYSRGILYLSILVLLVAGLATSRIRRWLATALRPRWAGGAAFIATGLVAVGLLLPSFGLALQSRYDEDYYRRIDDDQYEDFVWVRDNLCPGYERALLDPKFGTPFAAITGRQVYATIPLTVYPVRPPAVDEARQVLREGVPDAAWLREHGLSIVYSTRALSNAELVQVHDGVYVLPAAEVCKGGTGNVAVVGS
ncbi:MAG: hypothetical protein MUP14_01535, partial [Dehalococcoidia bacterium]|nr:hypothetical protein [Dehalococcoidia bacterium]